MNGDSWVEEVLSFWFGELKPEDWYSGQPEVDDRIRARFDGLPERLAKELPVDGIEDARTALAAVIVFDQFPRNLHRRKPEAFATDALALSVARNALDRGFDAGMEPQQRQFLYMPFMHSEVLSDQERCVDLFRDLANEEGIKYAIEHRDIIAEFGRFPHRNRVLGRESTDAERAFLEGHAGYGQ